MSAGFLELKICKCNRNPKELPAENAQMSVAFIWNNNSATPILLNSTSDGWEQKAGQDQLKSLSLCLPSVLGSK